jgi:hypothetical protein
MSLSQKISACSSIYSDKLKILRDPKALSKSVYRIENNQRKEFKVIPIDSCVFDSRIDKCDFGLEVENTIHFIELKGKDNNKGLRQLHTTLTTTHDIFRSHVRKVRLIVSEAEAPRNLDQTTILKISRIVNDTLNSNKGHFIKTNNSFTEIIN